MSSHGIRMPERRDSIATGKPALATVRDARSCVSRCSAKRQSFQTAPLPILVSPHRTYNTQRFQKCTPIPFFSLSSMEPEMP